MFCKILDIYDKYLTKIDGIGYIMSFSNSKYPNPIQTQYESENYGYFIGILIIDPNRSGSEKNRSEPKSKISKYLLDLNI